MAAGARPIVALLSLLACLSCATHGWAERAQIAAPAGVGTRPFLMGFTTARGGPRGGAPNSERATLRFIRTNADLITIHRDGPDIPWQELADGETTRFRDQLLRRRARVGAGLPLYVLITPLSVFRNGIGGNFPSDLGPACVSNPTLRVAFKNYALVVVEALAPDFLGIGSEVNIYANAFPEDCPDDFDAFVSLYKETYRELKALHPTLPIFPTFQLDFLHLSGQQMLPARFAPELDRLALSTYPAGNLTQFTPGAIPDDYIRWARVATNAPLVIAETGYGSRAAGGSVGSPELQVEYVRWLMEQATAEDAEFVNWFFSVDPRHIEVPAGLEFINSFRYLGLATPRFKPKPALEVWRQYLALPLDAAG